MLGSNAQFAFSGSDPHRVYLTHVSVDYGPHDIPAYVIRITGLDLPPNLGTADPVTDHHEMIVLVDAMTGRVLMGETFR